MKNRNFEITDYCEKQEQNSLPLLRGGIGRGDDSFETLKIEGFQKKKSLHLIHDPSPERGEGRKRTAFTLAETLITLTILGVVAAITVPMLINKQMEAANRTKLKKAMAAYEKALNQMIIDNDIKSSPISSIEGFSAADGCSVSTTYFKKINGNGCRFQTADKVYWDISDIEHPVISLKDEITDDNIITLIGNADSLEDDKTSFVMVGEIKDGVVRINDKGTTTTSPDSLYVSKSYDFINNTSSSGSGKSDVTKKCSCTIGTYFDEALQLELEGEICGCTGSTLNWNKVSINDNDAKNTTLTQTLTGERYSGETFCNWDPTTKICTESSSTATAGDLYLSEEIELNESEAKSAENCAESIDKATCETYGDYWTLARRKCEAQGGRLPTAAEMVILNNNEGLCSGKNCMVAEAIYGSTHYGEETDSKLVAFYNDSFSIDGNPILSTPVGETNDISAYCVNK